ncbi:P-loop containing nucleoside triphosphate hydrolase protein [Parachaetomium inaequale]|uniref:P-loop containing nucleoside triphosphate hydrolase protein n=1 Tax=Parachaetomium inaequale TaxID=2588326 RepID=A0AAN6SVB8_9PEZI|nr:P-loop containing nucleoside triphosphate hydrolase protein [Parachaetomium inaequale]
MSVLARPRAPTCAATLRVARLRHPAYSTSSILLSAPRRSNYFNSGYTSSYDPSQETGRGPIFNKHTFGVPQFYPRDLKRRVDDYVVGQDRAKKTICSVIFNHYQGLRRRQHHELQDQRLREKLQRQKYAQDQDAFERAGYNTTRTHPVEDDYPGHHEAARGTYQIPDSLYEPPADDFYIPEDFSAPDHVKIDKSNLLLIGPTGVGKTYILETLSKKLNVPFTISDCNSFTQAGYIGQDVESCIERLLIEANYDIKAAEHGIVVLDEFDKIAKRETVNGRDVGGEGVQQALLKLVEGTKITINIKDHRSSRTTNNPPSGGYGPSNPQSTPPSGKVDQYTIDTTNILFVFCGAFVGLDKTVLRRVAKPSIGFGSEVRGRSSSMSGSKDILPPEMYTHLPHQPPVFTSGRGPSSTTPSFTPLDITTPADLQTYGFIPELIGRLHNICALTPLSLDELFRILTEPRNSLVAQYTALFETYPSTLAFTRRALYAIAERAARNETGARGLKMEMERVLAEPMFDAPTPYVLVTEGCVRGKEKAGYWGKDGRLELERRLREEDERGADAAAAAAAGSGEEGTFEQFREAGLSGA